MIPTTVRAKSWVMVLNINQNEREKERERERGRDRETLFLQVKYEWVSLYIGVGESKKVVLNTDKAKCSLVLSESGWSLSESKRVVMNSDKTKCGLLLSESGWSSTWHVLCINQLVN